MSTALLGSDKFSDIHRSLIEHGASGIDLQSCSTESSQIARALGVCSPFGMAGKEEVMIKAGSFVFDLQRLNHAAYCARYEDGAEELAPKPTKPEGRLLNLCALLKALQCVRYNSDAGKIANASILESLKTLDAVIEALKDLIIDSVPEYQAADWF